MIKVSNQFEVINLTKCKLVGNNCNWICYFDLLVLLQHVDKSQIVIYSFFEAFFFFT